MANIDWVELAGSLKVEVLDSISGLVDGTTADLEEFGRAIALDLVSAAKNQDASVIQELGHQLLVLAEINRIRVVNATWQTVTNVLTAIGRVMMKMALAAI